MNNKMDKKMDKSNNQIVKSFDYAIDTINNKKMLSYPINTINIRDAWVNGRRNLDVLTNYKYSQKYIPQISKSIKAKTLKLGTSLNIEPKDLIKISNKVEDISDVVVKKVLFGSTSKKQLAKINKLKNMSKTFKNVSNMTGKIMSNSAVKKIGGSLGKAFSPIGMAMNIHTFQNKENSDFKRLLAGADIVGDMVSKFPAPIAKAVGLATSTANFAGGLAYDFLDSKLMEPFGGKEVTKVLDTVAGAIVSPIKTAKNTLGFMKKSARKTAVFIKKTASAAKENRLLNSLKAGMNLVKKKTPEPIKKALTGYANMYLHPIQTAKKVGAFLADKSKDIFKKPNPSDFNDIYYRNFALSNNRQSQIQHNGQSMQNKLQGSQTVSPSQNTFTININGTNKSTQEIMNEIVPEIKLRMKNISIA